MSLLIESMQESVICHVPDVPRLRSALQKAVVFEISNVANYALKHCGYERWADCGKVFPNLAPPFESFWMEYENPAAVRVGDGELTTTSPVPGMPVRVGSLFIAQPGKRWSVAATHFTGLPKQRLAIQECTYRLELNPDGSVSTSRDSTIEISAGLKSEYESEELGIALHWIQQMPMLLATTFLHCKRDVLVQAHEPPPKLAKANLKRGKQVVRFNTIEIESITEILKREGRIEENGLGKALHICRGHFARYTEDGPGLFRKGIYGTFWIPQHLRGKADHGVVASNYKVNAPKV